MQLYKNVKKKYSEAQPYTATIPHSKPATMTQLSLNHFDVKKAGQVVFYFLKKSTEKGMHVTKLRLIKWLYLAERASYEEFGEPLTGDKLGALRHGPAPSETLGLIEGTSRAFPQDLWSDLIQVDRSHHHQYVSIAANCPYKSTEDLDRFSEAEIDLLEHTWKRYGKWSAKQLETHLHDTNIFPEWNWKKGDGTNWIEIETILASVGFDENVIDSVAKHIVAFDAPQR